MLVTIRLACEQDVPAMAALRAQTRGDAASWTVRIRDYMHGTHSPQQALGERALFVALADQDLVGLVAGHRTRRFGCDGELQWIDVAQPMRGRGIATRLMAHMGVWFVEQTAFRICVNVAAENAAARRLYARCGAHPLSHYWMCWDDARVLVAPLRPH